jgi:assimilatory nitrate reductase catalytic subunit
MTNSERRISRARAAVRPPGEARADWKIAVDFARRLEKQLGRERLFEYEKPEDIFNEHRETTRGRDLDITGLSYALLDERGPQQWPLPENTKEGRKRLYEDGVFPTASGRARFVPTPYCPVAEDADARYPLRLTTGRLRDQWHTMSRTGTIAGLFAHEPEPRLTMNPADFARSGVEQGELVKVISRRGHVYLQAAGDPDLPPGTVFIPMHWGARFLGGEGRRGVNELTIGALDPSSKQPELKHCAVRLEAAALPWQLVAFGSAAPSGLGSLMNSLERFMSVAPYAVRTPIGRDRPGMRLALAAEHPLEKEILREIDGVFGLNAPDTVCYEDDKRSLSRRVLLEGGTVSAVRLSGGTCSEPWLRDLWERAAPVGDLRRYLLLPVETPPGIPALRGRTLCNCFDIAERDIDAFLAGSNSLAALQAALKCGTNCGSCLPELRRKIASRAPAPFAARPATTLAA